MLLYLLRHANADTPAPADDDRELSKKGFEEAAEVGRFCKRHKIRPALILTSPLRRAHATALAVAEAVGGELIVAPWLSSGMQPQSAVKELHAFRDRESVMIAGHEPDFSTLAAHLLGLPTPTAIHVRKASLTALELPLLRAGAARLEFSIPCQLM